MLPAFHHFVRKRLRLQTRETDTDDCSQNELQSMISETDLNNESSSFDGWYFFSIIKFRLVRFYILWFFIILFLKFTEKKYFVWYQENGAGLSRGLWNHFIITPYWAVCCYWLKGANSSLYRLLSIPYNKYIICNVISCFNLLGVKTLICNIWKWRNILKQCTRKVAKNKVHAFTIGYFRIFRFMLKVE